MQNYTISEMVTLPSLGKIYEYDVDPHIELRSMTTAEEMRRLSKSDSPYKNICSVIDACMIKDPGISSYDMCIGDYIFLLYKLRIITYGPNYKFETICPFCGCRNTNSFSLDLLPVKVFDEESLKHREFNISKDNALIKLKYQTPAIIDLIETQTKENKQKTGVQDDQTLLFTLKNVIDTINGKKPNPINIDNWIKSLPMADANTILNHTAELNNSIGLDLELQNECDICGLTYDLTLSITNEFFRPALNL